MNCTLTELGIAMQSSGPLAQVHKKWFESTTDHGISAEPCRPPERTKRDARSLERGLYPAGLCRKCKKCPLDDDHCCCKTILAQQPDFRVLAQKSLVQEVVEAAGHLCIFLPKFHCKLNFIEFFWGAVKKYL
jgi:hypothetical protein